MDETPLMVASKHGHINAVERLLEGGAYLEEFDMDNDTALQYAVGGNQLEVVKILLKKKADPNVVNREDWSCLLVSLFSTALKRDTWKLCRFC